MFELFPRKSTRRFYRSLKEFRFAFILPGSSLFPLEILFGSRRAFRQIIGQQLEDHPGLIEFIFFQRRGTFSPFTREPKQYALFCSGQPHEHQYVPLRVEKVSLCAR